MGKTKSFRWVDELGCLGGRKRDTACPEGRKKDSGSPGEKRRIVGVLAEREG